MERLYRIGAAAKILGVSISTLRRWEKEGRLTSRRTEGQHRLYSLSQFKTAGIKRATTIRKTIAYARVSGRDQKADLERQEKVLEMYCSAKGWQFELLTELGSG